MNILAFGASNHTHSINQALAISAAKRLQDKHLTGLKDEVQIQTIDLNDYEMPIYSIQKEQADGIHPLAHKLFAKIGEADALIISFAEYNGNYTSAWKNIFDWMSRIDMKVFQDKPMLALATSPGARGGASVLEMVSSSAPYFAMNLKGVLAVPSFMDNFDTKRGELTHPELIAALDERLGQLSSF